MADVLTGLTGLAGIGITVVAVILLAVFAVSFGLGLYKKYYVIVPPEQVHVVVTKEGKTAYMSKEGHESSYWFLPWFMTRNILPLEQIPISVAKENLGLHDTKRIPFRCDVVAWLVIQDPIVASERVGNILSEREYQSLNKDEILSKVSSRLAKDIEPMICAVARTASMKNELLDIMMDRSKFANSVEKDLDVSLKEWGLHMTTLEVLHIEDAPTDDIDGAVIRGVIQNWELQETKKIDTETRVMLAEKDKEARLIEAEMDRDAQLSEAEAEETARKRQIEKDQAISLAEQEKMLMVQEAVQKANVKQVEAERELKVGQARYIADSKIETSKGIAESTAIEAEGVKKATITEAEAAKTKKELEAEAEKTKKLLEGEGWAKFKTQTGQAEADATRFALEAEAQGTEAKLKAEAQGTEAKLKAEAEGIAAKLQAEASGIEAKLKAEAEGTDQLADAQAKMQDNAMDIKKLELDAKVKIEQYRAMAEMIGNSDTKIFAGGIQELFGVGISPEKGASMGVTISNILNELDPETKKKVMGLIKDTGAV